MTTIALSEFRANMRTFIEQVQAGEIISLTHRGEEVARIVPPAFAQETALTLRDELRETAVIGDLLAPLDVSWDAMNDS